MVLIQIDGAALESDQALVKRIRRSERDGFSEIVGIVADSKYGSIAEAPTPLYFAAYTQRPHVSSQFRPLVIHVRTAGAPAALLNDVRRVISSIEPEAFVDVRTLRDATGAEAGMRRLGMRLFGVLGLVALLLATIGLYGVMAFVVSSRTREIGTRVALGAASGDILRGVLMQGLRMVVAGIASIAWWLRTETEALVAGLAGLSPADPVAFGGASLILLLVGLAACYFPARRAASLNPVEALRVE